MKEIILCKYGEILLKGANKKYFEDVLMRELRIRARIYGKFDVYRAQSTIYIEPKDDPTDTAGCSDIDGMFEAAKKVFSEEEATSALSTLREAEAEGSELAVMLQVIYYEEAKDKTGQVECLTRFAEKYPFFNLMLGESYVVKYHDSEDFSYIQKAIDCYYKADEYGMLIPKYANGLWGIYDYFGQKGMLEYDEQEIERLKVLAKRVH